jgi:glycosyltransferase involved in cell wall biosynthesis
MTRDNKIGVSIIIPVRNGAHFIKETLISISKQTYSDFEVIVVDDGSTDQTVEIVKDYMNKDSRFRIVANHSGGFGVEHARNYGISLTRADWIAECDADDLWHEDKLQHQVDFRDKWKHELPLLALGTPALLINDKGIVVSSLGARPTTLNEYLRMRENNDPFTLNHSSMFYKKSAFWDVGGYKYDYLGAEDTELISRIAELGVVINLTEPLFQYRKHLGSLQLSKTMMQELNLLRTRENIVRRQLIENELTYDQFVELLTERLKISGMRRFQRKVRGKLLYRLGAINAANSRYIIGFFYLAAACLFDYRIVWSGIRRKTNNNSRDLSASN